MSTKKPKNVQLSQFALYADYETIPLHKPTATRDLKDKAGKIKTLRIGKRPLDFNWTKRTYDTAAVIKRCANEGRNMGVRLRATDLVIDVDPRNDGNEGLTNLVLEIGLDLTKYPCVITGGGGKHYYGKKPDDVQIVDTIELCPGVEFKSKGRQVVAAGSVHPETGKLYKFDPTHPPNDEAPEWPEELLELIARPQRNEAIGGGQYSQEQLAAALEALDPEDYREHDKWLALAMACHHATGGDGRSEFIEWSISDPNYASDAEVIGRRWDSLHAERGDGYTYKTLNAALAEASRSDLIVANADEAAADFDDGVDLGSVEASTSTDLVRVESRGLKINPKSNVAPDTIANAYSAVVQSGLMPAWDELKQNTVFRTAILPWDESYGRVVTDHVLRLTRMYFVNLFQGVDYQPSVDNLANGIATVAYSAKFNPVIEYIDSLKWDGTKRVEHLFSDYLKCGDDAYTRAVAICFMIAAVRRMRRPGCKFDTMPILRSPQGWMKSTAIKALFGAEWYSDADLGNLRDKDSAMKLRGFWVQEFAEIESLTRAETGSLKAFCSRATDRQRDPYGRVVEEAPRRCVFIATVNEGGYLKDSTGARRFWPLEVHAPIDVARIAADRDQLWAEATALEAQDVSDVLPHELWQVAGERQADQTSGDPWADTIRLFLEARASIWEDRRFEEWDGEGEPLLPPDRVHTSELFDMLEIRPADQTKDKAQRLRTVMESVLGWPHRRNVRVIDRNAAGYTREHLAIKIKR